MRAEQTKRSILVNWFTVLIDRIMLSQCKSYGHHYAALNLTFTRQWNDCLAHIMCSNHFLNLTCFLIQDTHLRRIAVGYMGNRIRHICAKRICLCKIFPIINFTDHIINGLTCIAVLHNLIAGSAAGFPCYQSLSGTGSCT